MAAAMRTGRRLTARPTLSVMPVRIRQELTLCLIAATGAAALSLAFAQGAVIGQESGAIRRMWGA